jgi:RHS repeat-associated protein
VRTRLRYGVLAELDTMAVAVGGSTLYKTAYQRDSVGRIRTLTETVFNTTRTREYGYDATGRLEKVWTNGVLTATYVYDSNGNRRSRITQAGTEDGTYDAQDRMTSYGAATYSYAPTGEVQRKVVGADTTKYTYDALGNLRKVELPGGTVVDYVVDGQNQRIVRTINGIVTHKYLWQGPLAPAAELDAAGNVISRFVYGVWPNVPDYMVRAGVTYRLVHDHLGSVRLVVNAVTGAESQRLDYDEFGRVTLNTNPGFQPFGYAGGMYDATTDLVTFDARDYSAAAGRWLQRDPIGFASGTGNLYTYADGDPVNRSDPDGLATGRPRVDRLGDGYTARVDRFSTAGGAASHEIHVMNPQGQEVGVFGPGGWIAKHGREVAPEIPRDVFNKLNSVNVRELRAQGRLAEKGFEDIRGFKYLGRMGKALTFLGICTMFIDSYFADRAAHENGTGWAYEMMRQMGYDPTWMSQGRPII